MDPTGKYCKLEPPAGLWQQADISRVHGANIIVGFLPKSTSHYR